MTVKLLWQNLSIIIERTKKKPAQCLKWQSNQNKIVNKLWAITATDRSDHKDKWHHKQYIETIGLTYIVWRLEHWSH